MGPMLYPPNLPPPPPHVHLWSVCTFVATIITSWGCRKVHVWQSDCHLLFRMSNNWQLVFNTIGLSHFFDLVCNKVLTVILMLKHLLTRDGTQTAAKTKLFSVLRSISVSILFKINTKWIWFRTRIRLISYLANFVQTKQLNR